MSVRFFYYKSSVCKGRIRLRYMEGVEFAWNIFTVSLQSEIFDGTCYREERFLAAAFGCCKKKKKINDWTVLFWMATRLMNLTVANEIENICSQCPSAASACPWWASRWGAASFPDLTSSLPKSRCCQTPQATNCTPQSVSLFLPGTARRWRCQQLHRSFLAPSIMERNKGVYVAMSQDDLVALA